MNEGLGKITRRDFERIIIGGGAAALGSRAVAQQKLTYLEALVGDDGVKKSYTSQKASGKKSKNVLSVEYATQDILQKLKRYNFVPAEGQYIAVVPEQQDKIGEGTESRIYVLPPAFAEEYKPNGNLHKRFPDLYTSLDIILSNCITNSGFVDADNLSHGINGYPVESFRDKDGNLNLKLYATILQLESLSSEYKGLLNHPEIKGNSFLNAYAAQIARRGLFLSDSINNSTMVKGMDNDFVAKLRKDYLFPRLFPFPK